MDEYEQYFKEVQQVADEIRLNKAFKTTRKGTRHLRDKLVFGKMLWQEAMTYVAIIQTIVIFTALIPASIDSLNAALKWIGISYQFPKDITSFLAFIFVVLVFVFGYFAVRIAGTSKRQQEIASLIHPAFFLLWKKYKQLEEKIEEMRKNDS